VLKPNSHKSEYTRIVTLHATSLGSLPIVFYTVKQASYELQIAVFFIVSVTIYQIIKKQYNYAFIKNNIYIPITYILIAFTSVLVNTDNYFDETEIFEKLIVSTNIATIMLVCIIIASHKSDLFLISIISLIGYILSFFLLYAIIAEGLIGVDLRISIGGLQPNWWGLLSFGVIACSLFNKSTLIRSFSITLSFYVMLVVSSRGAILASVVMILCYYRRDIINHIRISLASTILILGGIYFLASNYMYSLYDYIVFRVFLIDNEYRGVGTGLTGRSEGLIEAWKIFTENPIIGSGYGTNLHVHNGFLILLSETGLLMLAFILALIIKSLILSYKYKQDAYMAIIIGYIVIMMTYPRSLNLHVSSVIFLLCIISLYRKFNRELTIKAH